jgi:hypothetical protein
VQGLATRAKAGGFGGRQKRKKKTKKKKKKYGWIGRWKFLAQAVVDPDYGRSLVM